MGWDKMDISLLMHVPSWRSHLNRHERAYGYMVSFYRVFPSVCVVNVFYVFFEWMPQRRPRCYFRH